ncbi:MAG: hypothetical protein KDJ18_13570 [Hyphomicrobiaceae bacterium]|nr:hypothetical protein [Hyphomicrobiaceae bacterium]
MSKRSRALAKISCGIASVLVIAAVALSTSVAAQEGPGGAINPHRDCQTLLTCNFRKDGRVRGCLSSYSCRQCRFVASRCSVGPRRRGTCQRLVCDWGA